VADIKLSLLPSLNPELNIQRRIVPCLTTLATKGIFARGSNPDHPALQLHELGVMPGIFKQY
jgi:hypothetical protein